MTGWRATLTRHLTLWVLGALAVVWATFILAGYRTGQHEADELTDGHLASTTELLLAWRGGSFERAPATDAPAAGLKAHDYQQSLSVVVWDAAGRVLAHTGRAPLPSFEADEGFATLTLGQPPQAWRAFSRWDEARQRKVMVLLALEERNELAGDIAEQVVEPALWLLPVIALALGWAIRRGLRPLYRLSEEVRAMDIPHARPLAVAAPHEELRGMVDAINSLAGRYQAALTRERDLAGEFAHELRTPLASIALQARAVAGLPEGAERLAALRQLQQDALRAGEVLSHLLALARAGRGQFEEAAEPVDLHALAREVLADFVTRAEASGHALALEGSALRVEGQPVLLELALRNLVENAISHTPPGTRVVVRVSPAGRCVHVCSGPPAGQEVAPAGGALGLGLGLRVVEKVAAVHGARLRTRACGARRCYTLRFTAAPDSLPAAATGRTGIR